MAFSNMTTCIWHAPWLFSVQILHQKLPTNWGYHAKKWRYCIDSNTSNVTGLCFKKVKHMRFYYTCKQIHGNRNIFLKFCDDPPSNASFDLLYYRLILVHVLREQHEEVATILSLYCDLLSQWRILPKFPVLGWKLGRLTIHTGFSDAIRTCEVQCTYLFLKFEVLEFNKNIFQVQWSNRSALTWESSTVLGQFN